MNNIVTLRELCEEIGVSHIQAVELHRRLAKRVLDDDVICITQTIGTFYKKKMRPTVKTLNGVRYQVPYREAVALRGPRFPGRHLNCNTLDRYVVSSKDAMIGIRIDNGGPATGPGRFADAAFNLIFSLSPFCGDSQRGTTVNARLRISVGWSYPQSVELGASATVRFGEGYTATFSSSQGNLAGEGTVVVEEDLANLTVPVFTVRSRGLEKTVDLTPAIIRRADQAVVGIDGLLG